MPSLYFATIVHGFSKVVQCPCQLLTLRTSCTSSLSYGAISIHMEYSNAMDCKLCLVFAEMSELCANLFASYFYFLVCFNFCLIT